LWLIHATRLPAVPLLPVCCADAGKEHAELTLSFLFGCVLSPWFVTPASAVSLPVLAPSSSQVDAPPTVAEAHPPEGGPPSAAAVAAAAAFAGPLPGDDLR